MSLLATDETRRVWRCMWGGWWTCERLGEAVSRETSATAREWCLPGVGWYRWQGIRRIRDIYSGPYKTLESAIAGGKPWQSLP